MRRLVNLIKSECEKCNTNVSDNDLFCRKCGNDLSKEIVYVLATKTRKDCTLNEITGGIPMKVNDKTNCCNNCRYAKDNNLEGHYCEALGHLVRAEVYDCAHFKGELG